MTKSGERDRIRTRDNLGVNEALYQLSYASLKRSHFNMLGLDPLTPPETGSE